MCKNVFYQVLFLFIALVVRLSGSYNSWSGRVEIYSSEFGWGTVCDNFWYIYDGDVVCRELGFPGAKQVRYEAYYGEGSGPILLGGVNCRGHESHLWDCAHIGVNRHNCNHSEDAGVECEAGQYTSIRLYFRLIISFKKCDA